MDNRRIKVAFYATGKTGERMLRKGGCKVMCTTLDAYKRKMSPDLYATILEALNTHGVYETNSHRVKLI